jgi:hypothetical protein
VQPQITCLNFDGQIIELFTLTQSENSDLSGTESSDPASPCGILDFDTILSDVSFLNCASNQTEQTDYLSQTNVITDVVTQPFQMQSQAQQPLQNSNSTSK